VPSASSSSGSTVREPLGWIVLWTRQNKSIKAFNLAEEDAINQVVDYIAVCAATHDVYAAVGLQGQEPTGGSRGRRRE
jgi:hypothetical protein